MAKFWTCEYGSNHDIGERCDCYREEKEKGKKIVSLLRQGADGQMEFGGTLNEDSKNQNKEFIWN